MSPTSTGSNKIDVTDTAAPISSQEEPLAPAADVEAKLVLETATLALERKSLVVVTGTFGSQRTDGLELRGQVKRELTVSSLLSGFVEE